MISGSEQRQHEYSSICCITDYCYTLLIGVVRLMMHIQKVYKSNKVIITFIYFLYVHHYCMTSRNHCRECAYALHLIPQVYRAQLVVTHVGIGAGIENNFYICFSGTTLWSNCYSIPVEQHDTLTASYLTMSSLRDTGIVCMHAIKST